jgi:cytidylate kinase
MNDKLSFEKCRVYIDAQLGPGSKYASQARKQPEPTIAISRQAGAGGIPIAEHLAEYLQTHGPKTQRPWTVFDKNLVEQVLADHHLPKEIARYMPEDRISQISDMVEELLGLHPPSWTLLRQTTETILHLAELGNVILVGRGASVITSQLDNVFHVRLIGSVEERVKLLQEFYQFNRKAALEFMRKEDVGRRRYVRRYFHRDIEDPMLYHVVVNTDRLSYEEATRLIGDAVLSKFYKR